MAFSKFEPHRSEPEPRRGLGGKTSGERRAVVLKWLWLVSALYAGIGYVVIFLVLAGRWPF